MYDVIIVGAGPSGSSAARECAQSGLETLLIDKAIFPRDKLCGGALSGLALSYLGELPQALIERDIYGARIHFEEDYLEVRKPYRVAALVSRTHFDHFLLQRAQKAGVEVLEGQRVSALEHHGDHVQVFVGKDKYPGRIVIGCDGFHSVVARYVRSAPSKNEYGICIESKIPADDEDIERYISGAIDIHFSIAYGGYGWVFPHSGYFSVGIGGLASRLEAPKATMRAFLAANGFSLDVDLHGFPVPLGGVRRDISTDRILLAGDAAGFVDAFQGEGLAFAIRSGQIAGKVAVSALRKGYRSRRDLDAYQRLCRQEFGRDLQYALYFSRLVHRFPMLLRVLALDERALAKYLEIPTRYFSYRQYLGWLLPRMPFFLIKMGRR